MDWKEFSIFLSGLDETTPLGRIVAIRSENNADTIKQMTPDQKRIRNEWRKRQAQKKTPEELKKMYAELQTAVIGMVGGKG